MNLICHFPNNTNQCRRGVALVIVLAFVVLVTGLILAFFSRAMVSRQVSNGSAGQTKADMLAGSATDIIVGDLKQEIVNGSIITTTSGVSIYTPSSAANMLPARSGCPERFARSHSQSYPAQCHVRPDCVSRRGQPRFHGFPPRLLPSTATR